MSRPPGARRRLLARDTRWRPGRDRRAVRHPGPSGRPRTAAPLHVVVIGGGIAGLAAATVLAERGVRITLLEREAQLGGRVRSWPVGDNADRTMSRGFHAFFRQYYTLRALLRRADPELSALRPVGDYPLQLADGPTDSFAAIGRTPPWSIINFVRTSPTFPIRALADVDVPAALELVRTRFPQTFIEHDGESAQAFLDRLRFPHQARHLALEVFARSFFADPHDFSAGELIAMFHTYFTGSAEGLLFDVPVDDYDTVLWAPLGGYLTRLGVDIRTGTEATALSLAPQPRVTLAALGSLPETITCDAIVLATDPGPTRALAATFTDPALRDWQARVAAIRSAPPFVVWRLWLDRLVDPSRPAFLGTAGFGVLDNVSVLERFEATAAAWTGVHGGSVLELHAYAVPDPDEPVLRAELRRELTRVFPETAAAEVRHEEFLVRADCGLMGVEPWADRAGVETPDPRLVLAGDTIRCAYPVALMERAAVTGVQAANQLLAAHGVAGEDVWTVPLRGLWPFAWPRARQR
ncbi:FAD-dependent oxidoreductase [Granulicoccus sp. GXG6511]|uniref:FAD-dependent oxidoreductase n=1 Tax=Granulicoccus sp. GXG6511 TaxID=3381351 RepID=UPI003D7E2EFB